MELLLVREVFSPNTTIGKLYVNGQFECFTLEDVDRQLQADMPATEIAKIKVYGKTAIPKGKYEVVINYSNRFQRLMPMLLNVPGFSFIRIHPGNTQADTEGCVLVGEARSKDFVSNSRAAFARLLPKIKQALVKEKVFITIQ